jgi:hypothetical protein
MKIVFESGMGRFTNVRADGSVIATIAGGEEHDAIFGALFVTFLLRGHSIYSQDGQCLSKVLPEIHDAKEI